MSYNSDATSTDRYSSRYNRQLLKMLAGAKDQDIDKFINQYHNSAHYLERLESIKFLSGVNDSDKVSADLFLSALQDPCSQIKVFLLKNFDYSKHDKSKLIPVLRKLAEEDENIQVKTLAIDLITNLKYKGCFDLFFNASLMKSNKIAAAGLRGLYMLDLEKAYSMAKFKSETSTGPLDLIIAQIFSEMGESNDLLFFKSKFAKKSAFQKIEFASLYMSYLLKLADIQTIKDNLRLISDSISEYNNHDLTQSLVIHFNQVIGCLNDHPARLLLNDYLDSLIDELLERRFRHPVKLIAIS